MVTSLLYASLVLLVDITLQGWFRQVFLKLERLDLRYSKNLTDIPDLSDLPNLNFLILEGCTELIEVRSSRAHHASIAFINLKGWSYRTLSSSAEISRLMGKLEHLYLDGTTILELPPSIEVLISLVMFTAANCGELQCLPDIFAKLECLERVNLGGCRSLEKLPQNFGQLKKLKELHLDEKATSELPDDFNFPCLEYFRLDGCSNFARFDEICGRMEKLKYLHMDGIAVTKLPSSMKHLVSQVALFSQAGVLSERLASTLVTLEPFVAGGRSCLPVPITRPFRRIEMLHSGTSHTSRSRVIETTSAESTGFQQMKCRRNLQGSNK